MTMSLLFARLPPLRHLTISHTTAGLELVKRISTHDEGVENAHTIVQWSLAWLAHAADAQLDRAVLMHLVIDFFWRLI